MRAFFATLLLAVAAALVGCQWCVDGPAPHRVWDQPLGARCGVSWECAEPLDCIHRTCTLSCAGAPGVCPSGSSCIYDDTCLPGCATSADCILGATAGDCAAASVTGPAYCVVRACLADSDCAGGARCVGVSEARGITWNDYCEHGWCQL